MPPFTHPTRSWPRGLATGLVIVASAGWMRGQGVPAAASSAEAPPAPLTWTPRQDHQNMKDQLGITALRPGPSGRASPSP